jgi:4-diphosphocytidyl-2-C-methyl-D-erythritol kinase
MQKLVLESPSKINLHLAVKDRRPDGFHNLESIFLTLSFGDTLLFERISAKNALEIRIKGENSALNSLPMEENIIFKAVSLFRQKTGYNQGLRIRIEKRIPLGGGLGGGSSNAACTLLALNSLASDGNGLLGLASLLELAAFLGSDVPFFLYKTGAAWVSGRGEFINPLYETGTNKLFFVLVNPGSSSDTAEAFRLLDEFRSIGNEEQSNNNIEADDMEKRERRLVGALAGNPVNWPYKNDFLPVFLNCPKGRAKNAGKVYQEILAKLGGLGADFTGLTGAGSTCFGVFTDKKYAEKAHETLLATWSFVKLTVPFYEFFPCT